MNKVLARAIMTIAAVNDGKDGQTPHLHIAYANSPDGKVDFSTDDSKDRAYIGQYVSYTDEPDSTDADKYTWSLIKGKDAFVYRLELSSSQVSVSKYGQQNPEFIEIRAFRMESDKIVQLDNANAQIEVLRDGQPISSYSLTYNKDDKKWVLSLHTGYVRFYYINLYIEGKNVDSKSVVYVYDGKNGEPGEPGNNGEDAVVFRLIPKIEKAVVHGTKRETAKVEMFLKYMITRKEGEKHYIELGRLDALGLSLGIEPSWASFEVKWEDGKPYWVIKSIYDYADYFDDTPSFRVCLMQGGKVLDARTIGLQYEVEANFNFGNKIDGLDGKIDGIVGKVSTLDGRVNSFELDIEKTKSTISTLDGRVNSFEQDIEKTKSTVGNLEKEYTQTKQTADEISFTMNNGTRPNLLWGSDLDLSGVQDVINMAYGFGDIIKKKTEEKAEWKRKRDNADSDDDRMRYQDGMDVCDLKIAQAQGELAKRKAAIGKHLGVVISGDIEIGNKDMFEFQKGKGVNCSDAIRFKNAYKREDWAKWTNIIWHDVPLKPNTTYTISVWVKFKSYGGKGRMYVECVSDDGRYCFGGYKYKEHYYDSADIDEWQRVRYVFDSGASKKLSSLSFACIANEEEGAHCDIWICRPKLEEGDMATPWCAYDGTVDELLATGLDIKNRKFTATADNFVVQNNKGERTFMVDENGHINANLISAESLTAQKISQPFVDQQSFGFLMSSPSLSWYITNGNNINGGYVLASELNGAVLNIYNYTDETIWFYSTLAVGKAIYPNKMVNVRVEMEPGSMFRSLGVPIKGVRMITDDGITTLVALMPLVPMVLTSLSGDFRAQYIGVVKGFLTINNE